MGNRHGGEKSASTKEDKEERRRQKKKEKEKSKAKKRQQHKRKKKSGGALGSDVDLDPESSQFSRADSESLVFHSAENLSPYLDASTRSEDGAFGAGGAAGACGGGGGMGGLYDNGHILSSRDFHDGFSIEACLPADLAAVSASFTDDDAVSKFGGGGDDVTSMASGVYGTPLLSSPDVRRGIPSSSSPSSQSPLLGGSRGQQQRQKDSFLEPVPPIPSDFSSNTLSSVSYQEGVSTPGSSSSSAQRSCSSRASSSTTGGDANAAHCIERLEELERNIERTIIERFAHADTFSSSGGGAGGGTSSENATPRLVRRGVMEEEGGGSREGSMTPKGMVVVGGTGDGWGGGGVVVAVGGQSLENSPALTRKISEPSAPTTAAAASARSLENSPALIRRKISEPCRPHPGGGGVGGGIGTVVMREGSSTPKGVVPASVWSSSSQSAENSPVIVRKALPSPESPIILRRTPSQSPSVERKFPANAAESPVFYRRAVNLPEPATTTTITTTTPALSPTAQQRRMPVAAVVVGGGGGDTSQERSPQLVRREAPALPELEPSRIGATTKIPPPVPPKPVMKTLTSPEFARRLQNMPKSPIMARKVYAFQEQQQQQHHPKDPTSPRDDPWDRSWREHQHHHHHQMPPRSPSRSPEVRHRVTTRKTPSSSPSPKSLVRKLMPLEDRAPPPHSPPPPVVGAGVGAPPCPLTHVQFCQQEKGTPVKQCTVTAAHPSAAVVLDLGQRESSANGQMESTVVDSSAQQGKTTTQQPAGAMPSQLPPTTTAPHPSTGTEDTEDTTATQGTVSEDEIKKNTEAAVFGSVSPKLKRHQKILSTAATTAATTAAATADASSHRDSSSSPYHSATSSFEHQRGGDSTDRSTSSPPYSPPLRRGRPCLTTTSVTAATAAKDSEGSSDHSPIRGSSTDRSPAFIRRAQFHNQNDINSSQCFAQEGSGNGNGNGNDNGTLSADIAAGLTHHSHLTSDDDVIPEQLRDYGQQQQQHSTITESRERGLSAEQREVMDAGSSSSSSCSSHRAREGMKRTQQDYFLERRGLGVEEAGYGYHVTGMAPGSTPTPTPPQTTTAAAATTPLQHSALTTAARDAATARHQYHSSSRNSSSSGSSSSAVIARSTVGENARREEPTGEYHHHHHHHPYTVGGRRETTTHVRGEEEGEEGEDETVEHSRACWNAAKSEQLLKQQQQRQQRVLASSCQQQRVHSSSPPPPSPSLSPATTTTTTTTAEAEASAVAAVSVRGGSTANAATTSTSSSVGTKNLGQRIREVIHESSSSSSPSSLSSATAAFREVFTAELSPSSSSVERDEPGAGSYYHCYNYNTTARDDSSAGHPPPPPPRGGAHLLHHHPLHPYPRHTPHHHHHHHPPPQDQETTTTTTTTTRDIDSPLSSPSTQRATRGKDGGVGTPTGRHPSSPPPAVLEEQGSKPVQQQQPQQQQPPAPYHHHYHPHPHPDDDDTVTVAEQPAPFFFVPPSSTTLDSSAAIRRIDIDVNVILPPGEIHEEVAPASGDYYHHHHHHQCDSSPGSEWETDGGQGEEGEVVAECETVTSGTTSAGVPDQANPQHSCSADSFWESRAKPSRDKQDNMEAGTELEVHAPPPPPSPPPSPTTHEHTKTSPQQQQQPVMEPTHGEEEKEEETPPLPAEVEENVSEYKKGDKRSEERMLLESAPPPVYLPTPAQDLQTCESSSTRERSGTEGEEGGAATVADPCFASETSQKESDSVTSLGQDRQTLQEVNIDADPVQPCALPTNGSVSVDVENSKPVLSSQPATTSEHIQSSDCEHGQPIPTKPAGEPQTMTDPQEPETFRKEHVPPPSPTAMDTLAEEEEEEEGVEEEEEEGEDVNCMLSAHQDSDISSKISQEMQLFGETVVRRLSSLLESQASESDSCVEEGRTDLLTLPPTRRRKSGDDDDLEHDPSSSKPSLGPVEEHHHQPDSLSRLGRGDNQEEKEEDSQLVGLLTTAASSVQSECVLPFVADDDAVSVKKDVASSPPPPPAAAVVAGAGAAAVSREIEPVLHEELNTFSAADLPGERLVTSDTTETLSTDHGDTSASSKRESTASTATDETLTSFKTRSTTDSAEFEDAFILPESLVFVRSVNEEGAGGGCGGGGGGGGVEGAAAVVESGRIIKRPPIPAELTRHSHPHSHSAAAVVETPTQHKPRKKRRRQMASHDVSARADVTEPEPKRGSKQIQEVIDAYHEDMSDDSDISSSSSVDDILADELVHRTTYSRSEQQPRLPTSVVHATTDLVRKPKPPADRSTDSSDDLEEEEAEAKRGSSSSHDSSFRIPEIEETFGELMGVKTFLDDLEDKTPTSEPPLAALAVGGRGEEEDEVDKPQQAKDFLPPSAHPRRRSKTSPARTDRTESDLDVSEHRDDEGSTDSMYADDEDEGAELVFQRSYSEEHGGEVVLSCTIYNSATRDNDADSDDFWADADPDSASAAASAAAADVSYKTLETAADAAGSAFQNARIQMHDIHQHLQDLRRQMELLQDDITSTSLTLTPEFSMESEQRPVTE